MEKKAWRFSRESLWTARQVCQGVGQEARIYLTYGVYKVILQKSIPAQIRELVLYISDNQE